MTMMNDITNKAGKKYVVRLKALADAYKKIPDDTGRDERNEFAAYAAVVLDCWKGHDTEAVIEQAIILQDKLEDFKEEYRAAESSVLNGMIHGVGRVLKMAETNYPGDA